MELNIHPYIRCTMEVGREKLNTQVIDFKLDRFVHYFVCIFLTGTLRLKSSHRHPPEVVRSQALYANLCCLYNIIPTLIHTQPKLIYFSHLSPGPLSMTAWYTSKLLSLYSHVKNKINSHSTEERVVYQMELTQSCMSTDHHMSDSVSSVPQSATSLTGMKYAEYLIKYTYQISSISIMNA